MYYNNGVSKISECCFDSSILLLHSIDLMLKFVPFENNCVTAKSKYDNTNDLSGSNCKSKSTGEKRIVNQKYPILSKNNSSKANTSLEY